MIGARLLVRLSVPLLELLATMTVQQPRRSTRLAALHTTTSAARAPYDGTAFLPPPKPLRRSASSSTTTSISSGSTRAADAVVLQARKRAPPAALPSAVELRYRSQGCTHVVGVDEAGRGPLAGPVVAAAYALPDGGLRVEGVTDSKLIGEEDRERLYEELILVPGAIWEVSSANAQRIDEINILQATMESMQKSATAVCSQCPPGSKAVILIDGNRLPENLPAPAEGIIKGDSKEYCIAAASVLAKVSRDRAMRQYALQYPLYDFAKHKGYPTAAHVAAIQAHGACPIHRMTFRPLRTARLVRGGTARGVGGCVSGGGGGGGGGRGNDV